MKALIFDKNKSDWETSRGFELMDIPEPVLVESKNKADANYVIIKVHYAGVCGTDKGIWNRQAFKDAILNSIEEESVIASPKLHHKGAANSFKNKIASDALAMTEKKTYRIIGHEFFGEVVAVGSKVRNIKVGDFVSPESHVVCEKCYQCTHGQKEVCTNEKILGISHDGGFAEYAKIPSHILWKTDTSKIRPEIAAMQEPLGNAVHAASKVNVKGKSVAVFGLGPIGMFLTLILKGQGASTIIGVEPNPIASEMAKKLGIDYVIPLPVIARSAADEAISTKKKIASDALAITTQSYAHNQEVTDEIVKITKGLGVDVSFEMAGFNSSVNNCLYATRRGGDIVLFGIKQGDFVFEDFNRMIVRGFTIHCVIGRQLWQTWEETKRLFENTSNGVQEKLWNVMLRQGKGTIFALASNTSITMITLDDNGGPFSDCTISDIYFDGSSSGQTSGTIISNTATVQIDDVVITRCSFTNAYTRAISAKGSMLIIANHFDNNGGTASSVTINVTGSKRNVQIIGNHFESSRTDNVYISDAFNSNVIGNTFSLEDHNDYVVASAAVCNSNNFYIINSAVLGASFVAMYLCRIASGNFFRNGQTSSPPNIASVCFQDCGVITDNFVMGNNDGEESVGIIVNDTSGTISQPEFVESIIANNYFHGARAEAIIVTEGETDSVHYSITGNTIYESGLGTDNTYAAILINGGAYVTIANNFIRGKATANQPSYCIRENAATDGPNIVIGNICLNAATANISTQHASTVVAHNITS